MKHRHIWRRTSKTTDVRESIPYRNTATPSRIIQREERFRQFGGRTEACSDPECVLITEEDLV